MAEHLQSGPAELGAPMDYAEHERTYTGFLALSKLLIVGSIDVLLALALFSFGGGGGFWLGMILLVLLAIGLVMGLAAHGSVKPLIGVTIIGVLLVAITVG